MDLLLPEMSLLIWTVVLPLFFLLPVIALFNILRYSFRDNSIKLIWVLVILLVPVIGPLFYFLIGRKQKIKVA